MKSKDISEYKDARFAAAKKYNINVCIGLKDKHRNANNCMVV